MTSTQTTQSTQSFVIDLPPSCVAFCPTQPQYFVIGTYFLHPNENRSEQTASCTAQGTQDTKTEEQPPTSDSASDAMVAQALQKRTGSLILYRVDDDKEIHDEEIVRSTMKEVFTLSTEFAVLDARWTPHSSQLGPLLAVAASTGMIVFYRLITTDDDQARLVHCCDKVVADPSTLVLSLAWHPCRAHVIGLTLSNGAVVLCESIQAPVWSQDAAVDVTEIHHHDLEAWTLAFTGTDGSYLLSGGDDAVLQCSKVDEVREPALLWRDRRLHDAGVTAILPLSSELFITGSYDDNIRFVFAPATGRRRCIAQTNLEGGVWRLKLLSTSSSTLGPQAHKEWITPGGRGSSSTAEAGFVILASCMHAGARVVRLRRHPDRDSGSSEWEFSVLARFEEHRSMNYGCDAWDRGGSDGAAGTSKTIVSTSFYDKLVCLWRFEDVPASS